MNRAVAITFAILLGATGCANGGETSDTGPGSDGGSTHDGTVEGVGDGAVDGRGEGRRDARADGRADRRPDGAGTKDAGADVPRVPKLDPTFPPYGLTFTPTGNPGRAGGLTWTYTGIHRAGLLHIYWIVCDDPATPCGLSLDGPITSSSEWQFSAADSDLPSGSLVFTNSTAIMTADAGTVPLSGRLTLTIVDSTSTPIPFASVASLGVTARDGKYGAEITGTGFTVTALAEVEDTITSTWTPYLDYYDAAHSVPPDSGNAQVSFGASFYDD
jgi:hypothetical protein